jgi:hypothetical protein
MQTEWNETVDAKSLTVVIPESTDVSKAAIESAVRDVIEGEDDLDETTDEIREYSRGFKA